MNWSDIVVALISLVGACIGTIYGIKKANNLTVYRLEQLERKVDMHNNLIERMTVAEHTIAVLQKASDKFNDRVAAHGEQIDNVYTLAEKNESRIQMLERFVHK